LPNGRFKFRADLVDPVTLIITEQQLRISDADMPAVREWSQIVSSRHGRIQKSLDRLKYEAHQVIAFQKYFQARLEYEMDRIRKTGQGERDDDLLTLLAHALIDPADPMDMAEALSFLFILFPATHDTTSGSLMACMQRLTANPDVQRKAAENPSYIGNFIDEAMRHESPVRSFWRRAVVDTVLGGVSIRSGSWILLRTSSANHDDAIYESGDDFNPDRRPRRPSFNFGLGIHTCPGRIFALHIIKEVFTQLLRRARNFRFTEGANDFAQEIHLDTAAYNELDICFEVRRVD
jgi:cytochrome P450 family 150 subfamily A5